MSDTQQRIRQLVDAHRILLFMKGEKDFPQCGFSHRAVRVLDSLGVDFEAVNVLDDPEIREGVKTFSNWPTIPQLYIDGQFIGGSDIMMEMFQAGELQKLVSDHPKAAPPPAE